jgi:hypothetical protein
MYIYNSSLFHSRIWKKICSIYGLIRPLVSIKLIDSPQLVIIKRFARVVVLPVASILS